MRIFFSVGEPSGDLHGANLIRDIKRHDPNVECVGFGGPQMVQSGAHLQFELTSLAVMGIWQVLFNIRHFFKLLKQADEYFKSQQPDAVVLIDYPGFNWWIARKAKKHGIPVFYYGVPQMWAWAPWRVHKLRKLVDHVLCKLPFEVSWFEKRGCQSTYVGHPYFDEVARRELDTEFMKDFADENPLVVLLPGSRTQEVKKMVSCLLDAAENVQSQIPDVAVAVALLKPHHAKYVRKICDDRGMAIDVFVGKTPELISMADTCLACSGSVSLELLHFEKPTVIAYRVGYTMWMLRPFCLRTKYITLVNLLASDQIEKENRQVYDPDLPGALSVPMPEYLSVTSRANRMARWVVRWLKDDQLRQEKVRELSDLKNRFGQPGASSRAAAFILEKLQPETESKQDHPVPLRKAA